MATSSIPHEGVASQPASDSAAGSDVLGILGTSDSAASPSVHPEADADRPSGKVTTANVLKLLESQHYRCALTGRRLTPSTASLDHIVPVRHGGKHRVENAQVLHRDVNRAKGTMTNEEFIQLCREIVEQTSAEGEGK